MINALRWLGVLIAPLLGYVVAVLGAVVLTGQLIRLCPPELLVSGMCTASWYPALELAAISVAVGLGASLFVLLPSLVAPHSRRVVATAAFFAAAAVVSWFTWHAGFSFLAPVLTALGASGVTALFLARSAVHAA